MRRYSQKVQKFPKIESKLFLFPTLVPSPPTMPAKLTLPVEIQNWLLGMANWPEATVHSALEISAHYHGWDEQTHAAAMQFWQERNRVEENMAVENALPEELLNCLRIS